ncbi:putative metalloprotease with PDZ domain [Sphingomonas kyeonggiensis]|uniref:Putative metalloprotease with PDZ domain n=1 Tax=Sphingomonas kyeonggiensis TaxID=1268553 RepID=A0A7W7NQZ9_9SPHN|nr:PDZ domain-containing protein [Sphingomonas kyeonggiensis]MBB4838383.1 putative metalloprotease with PDZ domain [Sphingomonas kyeonggiensis]
MIRALATAALLASVSAPAIAQTSVVQSAPAQTAPYPNTIPDARDVAYPGTLTLDIDATDITRGIFNVKETIPVAKSGHMVLLYPKWIPGKHGPRGEIEKVGGLVIKANGKVIPWKRDPVDVYAFHIDVPAGAKKLDVSFNFVSATVGDQGRIVMTPNLMSLQFFSLSLYPAGYFVRRVPIQAKVTYPQGWTASSAVDAKVAGNVYSYDKTSYDILMDSPVLAGRYYRQLKLSDRVTIETYADSAEELAAKPEQIAAHAKLVDQAVKTFGVEHYDHYRFLLSISEELGGIGVEHHRSSENGTGLGYFTKWDEKATSRNLLPHEYTHSWDGKFRRGADLWTPDYRVPMRGSLLWVYEGQTQFWGYVFQARSGLVSKADTLDAYANIAANLDNRQGRTWRPMGDTTNDPVITPRSPKGWVSWQRSEDYYNEGLLIWMEVDSILREKSGGTKSIDDFAHIFFGGRDGDFGELAYTFDDVVATLNQVLPYDWRTLLKERVNDVSEHAPLSGFERNGYKLVYNDTPNKVTPKTATDLSYSIGLSIGPKGITGVMWGSPAFDAGITLADEIVAVNGAVFSGDKLRDAVKAAKGSKEPIKLTVKRGSRYRDVAIDYHDGLRYPHLEKTSEGEAGLDKLLQPK